MLERLSVVPSLIVVLLACPASVVCADEHRTAHVMVNFTGIGTAQAQALTRTVEAARQLCIDTYGFDMPATINLHVEVRPGERVRLFNDGVDTFSLTLRSPQDLRKPALSGTFHLYGLCHEVGHLAMYRPIADDRGWLTTAGAEGWAHYLGSHLVDLVYEREGENLWPDPYDYREDGTKRLVRQLAGDAHSDIVQGAGLWREFEQIVGRNNMAAIFNAWGAASIDAENPAQSLHRAASPLVQDEQKLKSWLDRAAPVLFLRRPKAGFPRNQMAARQMGGQPRELRHDDGVATGRRSIAGGGHAVRFDVPDNTWYLTSVSVFGSRYGGAAAPQAAFSVWLCDEQLRPITEFKFPYSRFERGEPRWVRLPVTPTAVPQKFIVCVGFNPSARHGVYVSHDTEGGGRSLSGLPGRPARAFDNGDWMIRVEVDQAAGTDPLRPDR